MKLLDQERGVLEKYLPGLDDRLKSKGLLEWEKPTSHGLELYKEADGAGLLIPADYGGKGISAVELTKLTRALATRSPSLAIATTMHQFSVASLIALVKFSEGPEWMLLDGIARDRRLMASAFAEGRTAQGILSPTMAAKWNGKSWIVNGRKQPCSLSGSMDLLTASVALEYPDGSKKTGVALIPAESSGISVEPFWGSFVLAGAQSDCVILKDVDVHPDLIFEVDTELNGELDDLQTVGFIWFELLLTAVYLGVASSLVERVLLANRGSKQEQARLGVAVEGAALALYQVAHLLDQGKGDNDCLALSLVARYSATNVIQQVSSTAVEQLGGMAFVQSSEIAYLISAAQAIGFHPPSRDASSGALHSWLTGSALIIE